MRTVGTQILTEKKFQWRWGNFILQTHMCAMAKSHHLVERWIQGLVTAKINHFLLCAQREHTLSFSFLFVQSQYSNNHAVCYLQSKRPSYCPCMLGLFKFSWVLWSCEGKHKCCGWKAGRIWIQEGMPGWPTGLFFKALHPLLWIRSHNTVDSKSPPWPCNSWGGLKLCCYSTGAICFFLLYCLGI